MATITETWRFRTDHRNIILYASGNYSAASVTCSCSRTVDGTTTDNPSEGVIEYSFDGSNFTAGNTLTAAVINANGGRVEFRLTVRSKVVARLQVSVVPGGGESLPVSYANGRAVITVPSATALGNNNILLTLKKDAVTEDTATLVLTPKGLPGESSGSVDVSPGVIFIPADSDGRCSVKVSLDALVRMYVNGVQAEISGFSLERSGMDGVNISTSGSRYTDHARVTLGVNKGVSNYKGSLRIKVNGTIGDKTYSGIGNLVCEGNIKGEPGGTGQGHAGPMCYPTGEYSSAITYTQERDNAGNVICTPSVEVPIDNSNQSEIWYLDALTNVVNGVHVAPSDSGQTVWKQGLSNYNLIKTRYLFADFASLGSFIIVGHWLISQAGEYWSSASSHQTVDGGSTHYLSFKSSDPMATGSAGYPCFRPNFALDGMSGKGYTKNWHFSGNLYTPMTRITSSNYTSYGTVEDDNLLISLENCNNSVQIESLPNAYRQRILLPQPTSLDLGCELTVLNVSGAQILFLAASHIYTGNASAGYVGALTLQDNQFVRLKVAYIAGLYLYIVIGGGYISRSGGNLPAQLQ